MNRTITGLTAAAALTAAMAAAASPASATTGPRCSALWLGATLTGHKIAAGNDGWTITETNDGQRACTITGYPHLRLIARIHGHDHREDAIVTDGGTYFAADPGPRTTTLPPGASVTANLAYGNQGTYQGVKAVGLTVRTTGAAWALPVAFPRPAYVWQAKITVTAFTLKG